MHLPSSVAAAVQSWAAFHGAHQIVSLAVRFVHLAGLVVGGGAALAADFRVLGANRARRAAVVTALASTHRAVVGGLVAMALSGALMVASDLETFLGSRLYWAKMGLVGLLILNGVALLRSERAASRAPEGRGWSWLKATSAASLALWLVILYVGLWLTVAA
jgi:hypothetical protein